MFVTLYYAKLWYEGVWSGKRIGGCVAYFHSYEACQKFIYKILPKHTQKSYIEPTWIHWEIVTKKQYVNRK